MMSFVSFHYSISCRLWLIYQLRDYINGGEARSSDFQPTVNVYCFDILRELDSYMLQPSLLLLWPAPPLFVYM
jgi:hypothetical protein